MVADFYFKKFSRTDILEAFRRFDHNHDGYIEAHELKQIFAQLGRNFTMEEVITMREMCSVKRVSLIKIRRMIAQVDRDGNGKISIEGKRKTKCHRVISILFLEFAALVEKE